MSSRLVPPGPRKSAGTPVVAWARIALSWENDMDWRAKRRVEPRWRMTSPRVLEAAITGSRERRGERGPGLGAGLGVRDPRHATTSSGVVRAEAVCRRAIS